MLEPQQGMSVQEIIEWAQYAEKSGYGYIFRSDHLLSIPARKGIESPECWVTLGAIAARTGKIKFGPMVSPVGFRNPALLARMACTLHSFSKGRLILGFGAGWYKDEYLAHGYGFPRFRVRREEFEEALQIIIPLIQGKRVDFDGYRYSAHVECFPKPHAGKIHLVLGGRSPKVVETIAKFADEWNIFSSPMDTYLKLKKVLDGNMRGRKVVISRMGPFIIANSERELEAQIRKYAKTEWFRGYPEVSVEGLRKKGIICGTSEEFAPQVNDLREVGVEKFYFQLRDHKDKEIVDILTDSLKKL